MGTPTIDQSNGQAEMVQLLLDFEPWLEMDHM